MRCFFFFFNIKNLRHVGDTAQASSSVMLGVVEGMPEWSLGQVISLLWVSVAPSVE